MQESFVSGNSGDKIRSDCEISFQPTPKGGRKIHLQSKVKALYGESIQKLIDEICDFYGIQHAEIIIRDAGALPFVIAARMEAVVRKVLNRKEEFLLTQESHSGYKSKKDRFRFSRLYLPGNNPSMMINAGIHNPDGIILDLEDSVAPAKKQEARLLVRNALRSVNFYGAERMVRINQFPAGLEDLNYIVPHNVHVILLPKCESAAHVTKILDRITEVQTAAGISGEIFIMPILESALGIENAFEIASASDKVIGLAIGLEDYTADLGASRTKEAKESFYARTRLVNACKAAGIQAIDSVFSDVGDEEGLRETIKTSKSLGFEGMGCIHPRQIKIIHESFAPSETEIEKAKKIVNAFFIADEKGLGVVSLGTKMIDPPVVKRAQRIINLAVKMNLISPNWRENYAG